MGLFGQSCPPEETKPFSHLAGLLGGWFHQDYDIAGESLEEIMSAYRLTVSPEERAAVRQDIDCFLTLDAGDLTQQINDRFRPDIDPLGWGLTPRAWLERLRALL